MLIVNYDKDDPDKFLRYVGVLVEQEYDSTNWEAAHSGIYLPEGVYFVPQPVAPLTDGFAFDSVWPAVGADPDMRSEYYCTGSGSSLAVGAVEYPVDNAVSLDASTGMEQDWIGFQFGPDGHVKKSDFGVCSSASGAIGNHIVLGLASYQADGNLLFENSQFTVGIYLRANGVSYAVNDPNEL